MSTSEKEKYNSLDKVKHNLIRESMKLISNDWHAVEVATLADIPGHGTGLGTSASVTVGTLHALGLYKGQHFGARELAEKACHIEIDILGYPSGVQDQFLAAFGGARYIEYGNEINVSENLNPHDLMDYLLILYTGKTRNSYSILSPFVASIEDKVPILKQVTSIAKKGYEAFKNQDWELFGYLLDKSWDLKKRFSNASNSYIDYCHSEAKSLGAWGGKILGAGQGGFLLFCVPKEKQASITNKLGMRQLECNFSFEGSKKLL